MSEFNKIFDVIRKIINVERNGPQEPFEGASHDQL